MHANGALSNPIIFTYKVRDTFYFVIDDKTKAEKIYKVEKIIMQTLFINKKLGK